MYRKKNIVCIWFGTVCGFRHPGGFATCPLWIRRERCPNTCLHTGKLSDLQFLITRGSNIRQMNLTDSIEILWFDLHTANMLLKSQGF